VLTVAQTDASDYWYMMMILWLRRRVFVLFYWFLENTNLDLVTNYISILRLDGNLTYVSTRTAYMTACFAAVDWRMRN